MVVFGATVEGDSLKVSNKAYSKTKALFAQKLLAVKDTNQGKDSRTTLLPPWMTPLASPVISQFLRPTPQFWVQDDLLAATPDGTFEPVKSTVDMNDAEFRTNTLLAFTGGPYKPTTAAGSGKSTSSSLKGANAAKALPKDGAKRVSPKPGSPDTVTSSTGDGIPSETKKTATPMLTTITEESKAGNDDNDKASSSESSDSGSDDDASGSNDETGKGQSRSGTSSSSSSDSDSSSSNTPVETDEMNALLHNSGTDTEAGEKSDAGVSKQPKRPPLKLVLTNPAKPSTSGAKGTTVKYGNLEVLPGDGVVMANCTPGTAEVDARMQNELENKREFLQEVINKNLKQTGILLDSQELCKGILAKKAQSLMTSMCGVAEMYVSEITKLSVSFLKGAEDLEAAIRLGPTTRAKNSMAELEKQANMLLDGGNQLSTTYEAASDKFFPDIYSAEEEMKDVLRKCTNDGIKCFAQAVMDESVTPFSSTPELKVLGTEIAQMSYQHKVNINLIRNQMSGDALYSRVRPILAQACASKAQLVMTQFLAKESVRSYKACVGPCVFGGTPALPLPGTWHPQLLHRRRTSRSLFSTL